MQNAPIESSTALMATLFVKNPKFDHDPKNMSSSQSCSHRNSVQNAPIESSTALTATLFVNIYDPLTTGLNLRFEPPSHFEPPVRTSTSISVNRFEAVEARMDDDPSRFEVEPLNL